MSKNSLAVLRSKKLPTYDDACKFLAAMVDIAPVKEIKDQADGIKEYAIAAKDAALLEQAIRIRYEAWRTIGRIIRDMQKRGELLPSKGGRPHKNTTHGSSVKTLRDLGFSANESSNAQWLLDLPKNEYERRVASIVKKMVGSLGAVFRQAMRDERKKLLYAKTEIAPGLHVGDFRDLSPELIDDESVELVFIDPPYDEGAIPLYEAAAAEAKRILKPGGSLVSYSGHFIMPDVLRRMQTHLKYIWICADCHLDETPKARLEFFGIIALHKPLLWFVKDYRGDTQKFIKDVVVSVKEKEFHPWQQSVNVAEHFIEPLTSHGGSVVDFFAGGGTTLVAAKNLGRDAIGFEIDPDHAARAAERLAEWQNAKRQ